MFLFSFGFCHRLFARRVLSADFILVPTSSGSFSSRRFLVEILLVAQRRGGLIPLWFAFSASISSICCFHCVTGFIHRFLVPLAAMRVIACRVRSDSAVRLQPSFFYSRSLRSLVETGFLSLAWLPKLVSLVLIEWWSMMLFCPNPCSCSCLVSCIWKVIRGVGLSQCFHFLLLPSHIKWIGSRAWWPRVTIMRLVPAKCFSYCHIIIYIECFFLAQYLRFNALMD